MHDAPAIRRLADFFKYSADPLRIEMLKALRDGERQLKNIIPPDLSVTPAAISYHLKYLKYGDLIDRHHDGQRAVISLTRRGRRFLDTIDTLGRG